MTKFATNLRIRVSHEDTEKTDDGRQTTEDRRQKTEDRRQRTEDRGQKTEDRRQRTDDGRQTTEDRRQTTEDRRRKTDDGREGLQLARYLLPRLVTGVAEASERRATKVRPLKLVLSNVEGYKISANY